MLAPLIVIHVNQTSKIRVMKNDLYKGWIMITAPLYLLLVVFIAFLFYMEPKIYSLLIYISFVCCYYFWAEKRYIKYLSEKYQDDEVLQDKIKKARRNHILC